MPIARRSLAVRSLLALTAALALCAALAGSADAGAWGVPSDLSVPGRRAEIIHVGADAAGDRFAVWQYEEGSEWVVQAATRPVGGSWSAPVDVSTPSVDSPYPSLAVNAAGEAVVVWSQRLPSGHVIEAAHGGVSNSWASLGDVSSPTSDSSEPMVGIDAAGNATVAWRQYLGSNYGAAVATEEGASWSTPEILSNESATTETPSIVVDPAGDAVVAWEPGNALEASHRPAGGSWSPAAVFAGGGVSQGAVKLAIDPSGEAIATWENAAAGYQHWVIEAARMKPSGSWDPAEVLTSSADSAREPGVAISASGEARVAWQFGLGGTGARVIQTKSSVAAGAWSAPTTVSASGEAYEPAVGIDSHGNTTIAWWASVESGNYAAFASRMPAGGTFGPELALSEPGEEIYSPALAVDGTGGAFVAWLFAFAREVTARTVGVDGARPAVPTGGGATGTKAPAPGPILCAAPSGKPSATSFVPTMKPGKTIPGVRARIIVATPSRVSVAATILYEQGGKRRSIDAGTYAMKVKSWRNLKVPLPSALRSRLPVGSAVAISLRIAATPNASGCGGAPKVATKKLSLKVVRVLR